MAQADPSRNNLVNTPGFIANIETIINPLWNSIIEMESYDSITNQMLLMEKYQLKFGIQSPINSSPIALVTMNENADIITNSLLEATIKRLMKSKICELTGLSIIELLELPNYILQIIIRVATDMAINDNATDKLEKMLIKILGKK